MKWLLTLLLFTSLLVHGKEAEPARKVEWVARPLPEASIARQFQHPSGCGFAAIINSFRTEAAEPSPLMDRIPGASDEVKIQALVDTIGAKPSRVFKDRKRIDEFGISSEDLCDAVNELRRAAKVPELKGLFLERQVNERPVEHVKRLHALLLKSLAGGVAPILECRMVEAEWNAAEAGFQWNHVGGHYVTVLGIHRELDLYAAGFEIEVADSSTGRKGRIYVHAEARNFQGFLGNGESGKWLGEQPFLAATVPQVQIMQNASWATRSVVYLHYVIGKE